MPKTGELGVFSRGDRSEINLFPGKALDNAYSGNVIDLCPVGALTSQEYRFKARPWDLVRHTDSVCPLCSNGCNIILDVRHRQQGEELLRIRPRENQAVNQWWICDEGRFTFGYFADPARLHQPAWREGDAQAPIGSEEVLLRLARALRRVIETSGPDAVGCVASSRLTNEELFLVRRFFRDVVGTPHLDFRVRPVQLQPADASEDGLLRRTDKTANTRGAHDLGIVPGPGGLDVAGMLDAAAQGSLKALFVLEEDLVAAFPGRPVKEALGRLDLLVVSSLFASETTALAHALLPALGFAEKAGSFTNFEGRIQKLHRALTPPLASQGLIQGLREIGRDLGHDLGSPDPEQIWGAIGEMAGPYRGIAWKDIDPQGLVPEEQSGNQAMKQIGK
jgi:NADH-quinone oxidoreductase subunit G